MSRMWIGLVPDSPRTHVAVKSATGGANLNLQIRCEAGLGRVVDLDSKDVKRVLDKIKSVDVPRYGSLARYAYVVTADGMDRSEVPATVAELEAQAEADTQRVLDDVAEVVVIPDSSPMPAAALPTDSASAEPDAKDDETKKVEKPKPKRGRGRGRARG